MPCFILELWWSNNFVWAVVWRTCQHAGLADDGRSWDRLLRLQIARLRVDRWYVRIWFIVCDSQIHKSIAGFEDDLLTPMSDTKRVIIKLTEQKWHFILDKEGLWVYAMVQVLLWRKYHSHIKFVFNFTPQKLVNRHSDVICFKTRWHF